MTPPLVTIQQIRDLDPRLQILPEEEAGVQTLVEESIDLVEGYLDRDLRRLDELPGAIQRVVQRMVLRTLQQTGSLDGIPSNVVNATDTAGPFSRTYGFESGSTSGGVWLTNQDKTALRPWARGRAYSVDMY